MHPIAEGLNQTILSGNPYIFEMLSEVGKNLYFPKGILTQSAEAKEKAYRINATIGIATEAGHTMCLPSVTKALAGVSPEASLTYASAYGLPGLRKAWQKAIYQKSPALAETPITLPVVTCGITHAISVFADVWVDPGDVVLIPDMTWGNYSVTLSLQHGAKIQGYSLFSEGGLDLKAFEEALTSVLETRNKVIVLLNFPQNPSGYTLTKGEADAVEKILLDKARSGKNIVALLDDAYFGLFYEEETLKESLFGRLAGKDPRLLAVKLDGATKEYFAWGLRVGFITYGVTAGSDSAGVCDALEKKTGGAVRGSISNASHLGQTLVLQSLQDPNYPKELQEKFEILKGRASCIKEVLKDPKYLPAFEAYPFNSGYFMCIRLKTVKAEVLRLHLLNTHGVGLIATGEKDLRIAFSCMEENQVQELFDTVLQGISELQAA